MVATHRDDDDPADPTLDQRFDHVALALGVLCRAGRDQKVVALTGHLFDGPRNDGEERIGNVGDHQADGG